MGDTEWNTASLWIGILGKTFHFCVYRLVHSAKSYCSTMGYAVNTFFFWTLCLFFITSINGHSFPMQEMVNNIGQKEPVWPGEGWRKNDLFLRRTKRQILPPFLLNERIDCFSQESCSNMKEITSLTYGASNVFYVATQSGIFKVHTADVDASSCKCSFMHNGSDPVLSIVMDEQYLYWLAEIRKKVVYIPLSATPKTSLLSRKLSPEMFAEDKKIHRAACTIPTYIPDPPLPFSVSGTYAIFNLTKMKQKQYDWFNSNVCLREVKPTLSFVFIYKKVTVPSEDIIRNACLRSSECLFKNLSSTARLDHIKLGSLHPGTEYSVNVVALSEANGYISAMISPPVHFVTTCTVPSAPSNLACRGVNGTALQLFWNEPESKNSVEILYKVYDSSDPTKPLKEFVSKGGPKSFMLSNLRFTDYNFTVRVYPVDCPAFRNQFSSATVTGCKPFQGPADLHVEKATDMEILVYWKAPEDNGVQNVFVQWKKLKGVTSTWLSSKVIAVRSSFPYTVTDLVPNTGYSFRTRQQYVGYSGENGWLYSNEVNGKTMPGVPGFPRDVQVIKKDGKDILAWTPPDDNGKQLEYYIVSLRNRASPNASRIIFGHWLTVNGISARSNHEWEITKLMEDVWYEFRVSAVNEVGEGDTSEPSQPFQYTVPKDTQEINRMWIIMGATGGLVILIVVLIFVVACWRCGKEPHTIYRSPSSSEITTIHLSYGMDLQLAQLRHMSELASIRGVSSVPQDYMDLLPLFPRDKLELTEFLGKGAFGEVFKGIASDVGTGIGTEQRVAVKTLREGSTNSEKCEFLMEAYFMNNFNHQNILSLLGVCLYNEPQYLIMELMDGGDLLHYLRDARPNPILGPKLTTTDLLDICLHVAAGCKYLEDQRFIHRDLAARNCLVSTKAYATENRIVKIGDFGLARDIYRNDYYHKVGEGLLPVRWMAPESLIDNIYTTQSDVWAFGVLLWEIMGFGQQPYPTYTNMEVLQTVRAGGRLLRPENCPKTMYALMVKCWHSTPTLRPSFNWALMWLREFKQRNLSTINSESDYDLSAVNYTTVTTSDEDLVDDELPTSNQSYSPVPHVHENMAFEGEENSGEFRTVVQIHPNPCYRDDEDDDGGLFPLQSENESSPPGNGNGYLHVSENSFAQMLADARSQIHDQESLDESGDSNNELNYSFLNFPPSRNQSQKSNIFPRCTNEEPCALPTSVEEPEEQTLLPYMGDLPITDEERLIRKQQWSQKSRNRNFSSEGQAGVPDNMDDAISPYLRGASDVDFHPDALPTPSPRHFQSENTSPKQLAISENSTEHLPDIADDGDQMAPYSFLSDFPNKNYQRTTRSNSAITLDQNNTKEPPTLSTYADVPTYV